LEGTVKRWLDRGYGFIGVDDELREGQKVEFDLEDSPKGPRAVNVKVIE